MVAKELTKAAGLENMFQALNRADNTQLAIITVFAEGFNAGIKAAQTSAELDICNLSQNNRHQINQYEQSLQQSVKEPELIGKEHVLKLVEK